jgi:hypothetical protein
MCLQVLSEGSANKRFYIHLVTRWNPFLECRIRTAEGAPPQQPLMASWLLTTGYQIPIAGGRVAVSGPFLGVTDRACLDARGLPGAGGVARARASRAWVADVLGWRSGQSVGTGPL